MTPIQEALRLLARIRQETGELYRAEIERVYILLRDSEFPEEPK